MKIGVHAYVWFGEACTISSLGYNFKCPTTGYYIFQATIDARCANFGSWGFGALASFQLKVDLCDSNNRIIHSALLVKIDAQGAYYFKMVGEIPIYIPYPNIFVSGGFTINDASHIVFGSLIGDYTYKIKVTAIVYATSIGLGTAVCNLVSNGRISVQSLT